MNIIKEKLEEIKEEYLLHSGVVFSEFIRSKISNGLILSDIELQSLLDWSGDGEYATVEDIKIKESV